MKININDTARLQRALDQAQYRCRVRKITVDDIRDITDRVSKQLGISNWAMADVWFDVDPNGQSFARSYKFVPKSTHFVAIYRNGNWFVTDIRRDRCRGATVAVKIFLTERAEKAIARRSTVMGV